MGNRGVSTVEYVLILLVVGISSILVVRNYGTEIKRLWAGAGEPLGVLGDVFDEEAGGITGPVTGDFETIEEPGEPSEPGVGTGDEDDDCAERLAAMQQEYGVEMDRLNVALAAAQASCDAAMETRTRYRGHGRWGGGYWTMEYVHPPEVRQAAQDRLDAAQLDCDEFQADWQTVMINCSRSAGETSF